MVTLACRALRFEAPSRRAWNRIVRGAFRDVTDPAALFKTFGQRGRHSPERVRRKVSNSAHDNDVGEVASIPFQTNMEKMVLFSIYEESSLGGNLEFPLFLGDQRLTSHANEGVRCAKELADRWRDTVFPVLQLKKACRQKHRCASKTNPFK